MLAKEIVNEKGLVLIDKDIKDTSNEYIALAGIEYINYVLENLDNELFWEKAQKTLAIGVGKTPEEAEKNLYEKIEKFRTIRKKYWTHPKVLKKLGLEAVTIEEMTDLVVERQDKISRDIEAIGYKSKKEWFKELLDKQNEMKICSGNVMYLTENVINEITKVEHYSPETVKVYVDKEPSDESKPTCGGPEKEEREMTIYKTHTKRVYQHKISISYRDIESLLDIGIYTGDEPVKRKVVIPENGLLYDNFDYLDYRTTEKDPNKWMLTKYFGRY